MVGGFDQSDALSRGLYLTFVSWKFSTHSFRYQRESSLSHGGAIASQSTDRTELKGFRPYAKVGVPTNQAKMKSYN